MDPLIGLTFDGGPNLIFTQGEDRSILMAFTDLRAGQPIPLTGATVQVNLPLQGGGSIKRSSGPVALSPSQVQLVPAPGQFVVNDHGFVTGDPVTFATTGTLPAPLAAGTTYLIAFIDVNDFGLTDTSGNPITLTTAGIGGFTVTCADVAVTGAAAGLATLTLRNLVTSLINAGQGQNFEVLYQLGGKTRIVPVLGQLDVTAPIDP